MGQRTWIKIYCDKWLTGTLREETSELRGIWSDVLALAGNLSYGDKGIISLPNNIPLTDEQIAGILNISLDEWLKGKARLIETIRIEDRNGILSIINWEKYQPEYDRQKSYRQQLQSKVTDQSYKEKEKEKEKENRREKKKRINKESSPSADSLSISSQQKETPKQKQDRRIQTVIDFIKKNWGEDFTPSQIQVLVYGQKREKGKIGFKTYETLWEFLKSNIGIEPQEGLYAYLRRCSMDEKTIYVHADKAWKNKDPKLIGEIFKDMAKEAGA